MPLLNTADAIYAGDLLADRVYAGDALVWERNSLDPATQAFVDASGLPESFIPALDILVTGLKGASLWQKMHAVYPFIGGTADLHKWNLIDPRDADAAYRLTFTSGNAPGGHSQPLGYQPNAVGAYESGGYADTHFVPSSVVAPDSAHLSLYSLEARANAARCDFGAYNWDGQQFRYHIIAHYVSGEFYYTINGGATPSKQGHPSTGFYIANRANATDLTAYYDGLLTHQIADVTRQLPYVPLYIGYLSGYPREGSDLAFGFASIGSGLSATEADDLFMVVREYETALGRQTPKTYW